LPDIHIQYALGSTRIKFLKGILQYAQAHIVVGIVSKWYHSLCRFYLVQQKLVNTAEVGAQRPQVHGCRKDVVVLSRHGSRFRAPIMHVPEARDAIFEGGWNPGRFLRKPVALEQSPRS
jgi:hypothetical protein